MNSRLEVQAGFLRPIYLVLLRISEPPQEASWCRVVDLRFIFTLVPQLS